MPPLPPPLPPLPPPLPPLPPLPLLPPPPPLPVPPPKPPVDSGPEGMCVWLSKEACDAMQAEGLCVRIPRKPKCLPSPTNGGSCNAFSYAAKKVEGRRKACQRAPGCAWERRVVTPPGQGVGHCVPEKP